MKTLFRMFIDIVKGNSKGCFEYKTKEAKIKCAESSINVSEKFFTAAFFTALAVWLKGESVLYVLASFITFSGLGLFLQLAGLKCIDKIMKEEK